MPRPSKLVVPHTPTHAPAAPRPAKHGPPGTSHTARARAIRPQHTHLGSLPTHHAGPRTNREQPNAHHHGPRHAPRCADGAHCGRLRTSDGPVSPAARYRRRDHRRHTCTAALHCCPHPAAAPDASNGGRPDDRPDDAPPVHASNREVGGRRRRGVGRRPVAYVPPSLWLRWTLGTERGVGEVGEVGVSVASYALKSSTYRVPMCLLFITIARWASAGDAKVT